MGFQRAFWFSRVFTKCPRRQFKITLEGICLLGAPGENRLSSKRNLFGEVGRTVFTEWVVTRESFQEEMLWSLEGLRLKEQLVSTPYVKLVRANGC